MCRMTPQSCSSLLPGASSHSEPVKRTSKSRVAPARGESYMSAVRSPLPCWASRPRCFRAAKRWARIAGIWRHLCNLRKQPKTRPQPPKLGKAQKKTNLCLCGPLCGHATSLHMAVYSVVAHVELGSWAQQYGNNERKGSIFSLHYIPRVMGRSPCKFAPHVMLLKRQISGCAHAVLQTSDRMVGSCGREPGLGAKPCFKPLRMPQLAKGFASESELLGLLAYVPRCGAPWLGPRDPCSCTRPEASDSRLRVAFPFTQKKRHKFTQHSLTNILWPQTCCINWGWTLRASAWKVR